MSSATQTSPNPFTTSARDRLASYLAKRQRVGKSEIVALTPDASTREYFRIPWNQGTAVAAVYPEPFSAPLPLFDEPFGGKQLLTT